MRNSNGYIYIELLAAFFIFCFITFSILPIYEKIMVDRADVRIRMEAFHLLYEKLQAYMEREIEAVDKTISVNGRAYQLTWEPNSDFPMMRGCIYYKNFGGKNVSVCDFTKR
ncbi:competence type IV pilus minor pilin ComGE [Bacillus sp. V5-8f]|uniref:competence type IV pilus minor pilin ComGE n=1 Tax=Bacillus sp. V5-8f TaxID=2053044 RepID=UPI000C780EFA|nr:competence type IV pilus minor pilin ComGE [Bacillus sp. V5-8f]PLT34726.1 hypothetical protein CUU64_04770 [Bacillus sp. V5-8f]